MGRTPKEIMLPSLETVKDEALKDVLEQLFVTLRENHRYYADDLTSTVITITDGDTTPDVQGGKVFKTSNSGATSITTFDNAFVDQEITIIFGDANTTIATSGNIVLNDALTGAVNDTIKLVYDGTNWREISRSKQPTITEAAKVKVSSDDTTPGYLNGKLIAGANISLTVGSSGGNETLAIAVTGLAGVPSGFVGIWTGAISDIPSGWVICDGNNGTRDLTDRFVLHADSDSGGTNDVGDIGGASTVTLSVSHLPAHDHSSVGDHIHNVPHHPTDGGETKRAAARTKLSSTISWASDGAGGHTHTSVGSGSAHSNRDKYYALAYIMKT